MCFVAKAIEDDSVHSASTGKSLGRGVTPANGLIYPPFEEKSLCTTTMSILITAPIKQCMVASCGAFMFRSCTESCRAEIPTAAGETEAKGGRETVEAAERYPGLPWPLHYVQFLSILRVAGSEALNAMPLGTVRAVDAYLHCWCSTPCMACHFKASASFLPWSQSSKVQCSSCLGNSPLLPLPFPPQQGLQQVKHSKNWSSWE